MATFIYPPSMDWTWMKQRPQQLMKELSRAGHTVYYCNKTQESPPASPSEQIAPNLYIVKHHERWVAEEWLDMDREKRAPVIAWCSFPSLASSLPRYQADRVVYDCVDDFAEWAPYEPDMAAMADAIVCTSERLHARLAKQYPGKKLALIRNAYDPDMGLHLPEAQTATGPAPADLPLGPTLGYVGAWAPWVDQKLVAGVARKQEGAQVVVIGPEFGRKYAPPQPRLHFLGMKPHELLPTYLRRLCVCLIPFRLNPVTLAANPVKAYEYLAAGKPVVSTDLPECRLLQPFVDVAASPAEFLRLADARLGDPGDGTARRQFALQHTWAHRVREIEDFLL